MLPRVRTRKRSAGTRKRKIFTREVSDLPPAPHRVCQHSYRLVMTRTRATRVTRSTRGTLATRATRSTRDTLAIRERPDQTTHVARSAAANRRWKIEDEDGKSKMKRPAGPQALWVLDKEKVRQWEVENEVGKWKM